MAPESTVNFMMEVMTTALKVGTPHLLSLVLSVKGLKIFKFINMRDDGAEHSDGVFGLGPDFLKKHHAQHHREIVAMPQTEHCII